MAGFQETSAMMQVVLSVGKDGLGCSIKDEVVMTSTYLSNGLLGLLNIYIHIKQSAKQTVQDEIA